MQLSDVPLAGIAVTLVLFGAGFVAFHHEADSGEERSDWLQRKWLGILLMAGGAFSLVVTVLAALE
jgi:O-antigen ligase